MPIIISLDVTSSGKSAPGPDPGIRHRTQIGMFRPIRMDHTNCLQVAIKSIQFPAIASTSDRLHGEFVRLLFLQTHRETDRFFATSGVQSA